MRRILIFMVLGLSFAALTYCGRFDLEYNIITRGVFEQIQVLERDRWILEGAKTELKYYDLCHTVQGICWRRLPDRSYWAMDVPSYDSPYIAVVSNNRNGKLVMDELRIFETNTGRELNCGNCDLSEFVRSERFGAIYITGALVSLKTYSGPVEDSVMRLRVFEIVGDSVIEHHLDDVSSSDRLRGEAVVHPNAQLRAVAWIVCAGANCALKEYWIDTGNRTQRVVHCSSGGEALLLVRSEQGRFVENCE